MKKLILLNLILVACLPLAAQDVAYWEPPTITQGGSVDIYYNTIAGTLPDNASNVLIHLGWNDWTNVEDLPMTAGTDGWWSFHFDIPDEADVIDFVFQDGQGNWDNNGGQGIDWHIGVDVPGLWEPLFPGPNDTIRISVQYPEIGYLWWGVNWWSAPIDQYHPENTVVGQEGLSVDSDLIGPDTNNISYIEIGPFNSSNQIVSSVDFVFHFEDGTWDNNNGGDYHIPMSFDPGPLDPTVNIINIEEGAILDDDQLIQIESQDANYVEVKLDGATRHISGGGNFEFTTKTEDLSYGTHQLTAFARRDNQRVMADIKLVWNIPDVVEESIPPWYNLGVHDQLDGTVSFSILAPGKKFISLVGEFNEWDPVAGLMKYDPAQGIFWLNFPLGPGEYEYLYIIDGDKVVGDPLATDVNWTDMFGNEHWASENQRSVASIGQDDFPWTDDEWVKPNMKDLIIYEMLLRDFTDSGDLAGLMSKMDYLEDLGVNAIELMPPTEFPGETSWGYNPAFFMAFESSYGTPDDFREFVDEAHARGMAVLIDLVFNHADGSSPYQQMYGNDYENSPYMHAEGNEWGFPDFDHSRTGTRVLASQTVRHWINEYHVDGYRYDHTPGVGWDGISYFANEAYMADNTAYQIAEHFDSNVWSLISATRINSHWHDAFHDQMKANLRQGQFEGSTYGDMNRTEQGINFSADGFSDAETCVNYIESHDEQRIIFEAQTNGLSYETALQKAELAAQTLFTSSGIPMFYMGAEFGMDTERTIDYNLLRWHYLEDPDRAQIHQNYKNMIWLRNNYPAFRSNNINTVHKSNTQKSIVFQRTMDGEAGALVAINFSTSDQTMDLEFPWAGTWYEYTQDDTVEIETNWFGSYSLPASSARIFTSERLWVGIDNQAKIPLEIALHPAYPNPFNPSTTLRFDLPNPTLASLKIYDVRGREVWSHSEGPAQIGAGSYELVWNGVNDANQPVATGLYFVELRTSGFHQVQKLMLVK